MKHSIAAGLAVFFMAAAALPAAAQMACLPEAALIKGLGKYEEQRKRVGISKDGSAIFELWLNSQTRTFTMTVRSVNQPKVLCIVAAGIDWHDASDIEGEDT